MKLFFTFLCVMAMAAGWQGCDPEFYWIWRIVTAVVMAILAIAWREESQ